MLGIEIIQLSAVFQLVLWFSVCFSQANGLIFAVLRMLFFPS